MKQLFTTLLLLSLCIHGHAQELPLKTEVPAVSPDPNLPFTVMHFDVMGKDKFSILYYHLVYASVIHAGEFVSDTGQIVFKDTKRREAIPGSALVLLLKKQILDGAGHVLNSQEWLLAGRRMESAGEYKLYFPKGFSHAMVVNRSVVDKNIFNLDAVKGLSEPEMKELSYLCMELTPETGTYEAEPLHPTPQPSTLAEDIVATRKQFKSLRSTGLLFKGDLPSNESVLTRYSIVSDRSFVITKVKEKDKTKPTLLKFYVTADWATFDCLDSVKVAGEVSLTSAATIYNTNTEAIGAFANLQVKSKDEKGEETAQQLSVAMDADYTIGTWLHSVGKNKLNSLSPEVCWYEGTKLWVLSNNREKFFKSYMQIHLFEKGKAALQIFPSTEEEKGSEKTKFVKTFQPTAPNGVGVAPALPERYIPIYFTTVGETRYIVMQGTRIDEASKNRQYLSVNIYRIDAAGKVTHVDMLSDYKAFVPLPLTRLVKNPEADYFLLQYPVKLQLAFFADRSEISPLDLDNSRLMEKPNREYLSTSPYGTALLRRTAIGTKYTLLFYPQL